MYIIIVVIAEKSKKWLNNLYRVILLVSGPVKLIVCELRSCALLPRCLPREKFVSFHFHLVKFFHIYISVVMFKMLTVCKPLPKPEGTVYFLHRACRPVVLAPWQRGLHFDDLFIPSLEGSAWPGTGMVPRKYLLNGHMSLWHRQLSGYFQQKEHP